MRIKSSFIFLLFITMSVTVSAQFQEKLVPPSEGKSVIYFVRTTALGSLMNIRYFDSETYLGKFNGRSYLRYECEPGEHTFWIKAENVDVLKANLEANKIYMVETNATMGAFSAGARFSLIDFSDEKVLKRINKIFEKKEETTFVEEELKEGENDNRFVIERGLEKVKKKLKKNKRITVLTSDMYIDL